MYQLLTNYSELVNRQGFKFPFPDNYELREDLSTELREDGTTELRE